LTAATEITNTAQLSVTAQVAVSTAIRVRHDVAAAAAAVVDVTVRLCAETSRLLCSNPPEVVTIYGNYNWVKPVMGGSNRKKTSESSKPVTNWLTAG